MDLDLVLDEGGGAFYGPKISVQANDAIGRTHQMSTIQLDFQDPQRFEMEYVGADNARHRPIMIHRALFGSVERFFAILLEHYAGALPTWLAPEQVRVLGVRDDHEGYADKVADRLVPSGSGSRSTRPTSRWPPASGKAKVLKIPYILVVGDDDVAAGHGRRQPSGRRPSRARGGGGRIHRGARGRDRRATLARRAAVSLEHLWAGWRSEYVTQPRRAVHRSTSRPTASARRPRALRLLPHRGQRSAIGRQRRALARHLTCWPSSTPTPTPAVI